MVEEYAKDVIMKERKRWLLFGIPWTFTKYTLTPKRIILNEGLLRSTENEILLYRIIDIEIEKEREGKQGQAPARSYGRYNNVFLSDTELDELKAELPDKWEYYIDRLSTHIASKGTKYRSHAATIYKWAQEDEAKKPPKKGIPDYTFKEGESL